MKIHRGVLVLVLGEAVSVVSVRGLCNLDYDTV